MRVQGVALLIPLSEQSLTSKSDRKILSSNNNLRLPIAAIAFIVALFAHMEAVKQGLSSFTTANPQNLGDQPSRLCH